MGSNGRGNGLREEMRESDGFFFSLFYTFVKTKKYIVSISYNIIKQRNKNLLLFFRPRIRPRIFVFENIFRTSNFVNLFIRSSNGMQMRSHYSCCKFDFNTSYFIDYLKFKFFLRSDSYQSNSISVVLIILR